MTNRDSSPTWGSRSSRVARPRKSGDVGALRDLYEGKFARFDGPIRRPWGKVDVLPDSGMAVVSLLSPEVPGPVGFARHVWDSAVSFFHSAIPLGYFAVRLPTALIAIGVFFTVASAISHSWGVLALGIPMFVLGAVPRWIVHRVPAAAMSVSEGRIPISGDGGPEVIDLLVHMEGVITTDQYQEDWSRAWAIVKGDVVVRDRYTR